MSKVEVLQSGGRYEILTDPDDLRRQLMVIERAGRICYNSYHGQELTVESAAAFIAARIAQTHESILEHSLLTVAFWGISRGLTHEAVRHRHASPSQRSTRYVDAEKRAAPRVIGPPTYDLTQMVPVYYDDEGLVDTQFSFEDMAQQALDNYAALRRAGYRPEDARQILPIGIEAPTVFSGNFHTWRDIFYRRVDKFAHWEIREVFVELFEELRVLLPGVFDDWIYSGRCAKGIRSYIRVPPAQWLKRYEKMVEEPPDDFEDEGAR